MLRLYDYARNIFSQFGEDGIIQKIFDIIGTSSQVCIDVGAWNGRYLSNTANLWLHGWKAFLIEANPKRYAALLRNTKGHNCRCIKARIAPEGANTLENVLRAYDINAVDFLSIDVDGDDYWIFKSLQSLRPRVICCEHNPTIPIHIDLVADKGNYFGCSVLALHKLAESKKYKLIAMTRTNSFFVSIEEFEKFSGWEKSLAMLAELAIGEAITYYITGYNGDYVLSQRPGFGLGKPYKQKLIGKHFRLGE